MPTEKQDVHQHTRPEKLDALDTISDLLTVSNFDLNALLNEICRITAKTLRMKACTIRLLDRANGEMVLKASYGLSPQYLDKGPVIAAKSSSRDVIDSGEVTEIFDVRVDSRIQYSEEAIAEGIRAQLVVGLIRDGRAIGALSIFADEPHHFTEEEVQTFQTIANQAAVAVYLAQLHQDLVEMQRIEEDLAIAAKIQSRMMPTKLPTVEGFDIAALSHPCQEVGGDFYDFIELSHRNTGLAVGDASGKSIPAALLMSTVRTALRVQAENVYAMREVIGKVNRLLCRDTQLERFSTLFYAVLDTQKRIFTYVNAGHNYPFLFRGDQVISLETGGPILGFFETVAYDEEAIQLVTGDVIVIYTDGFVEIIDQSDVSFGENRLCQVIRESLHLAADEIVQNLEDAVSEFECPESDYCDDRTVVVIKAVPTG